jgi:hypothetical protein
MLGISSSPGVLYVYYSNWNIDLSFDHLELLQTRLIIPTIISLDDICHFRSYIEGGSSGPSSLIAGTASQISSQMHRLCLDPDFSPDEAEEKARLISQVGLVLILCCWKWHSSTILASETFEILISIHKSNVEI